MNITDICAKARAEGWRFELNGDTNLKSIVRRLGIKKGECRKFQLVEVKE